MTKKILNQAPDPNDLEIQTLKDRLARALADYHNLEARYARESTSLIKYASSSILAKLLEVRDHLGLAAQAGDKSLTLILSTLDKVLAEEGVTTIRQEGEYDPALMECAEEVDGAKNQVIKTLRLGYLLHDRVLRHARVTVGNGSVGKDFPSQGHSPTNLPAEALAKAGDVSEDQPDSGTFPNRNT